MAQWAVPGLRGRVAFWALAEMVRQQLGIAEGDPAEVAERKLEDGRYLVRTSDTKAAAAAVEEACDIAARLRCQPPLDRAADVRPARPPAQA